MSIVKHRSWPWQRARGGVIGLIALLTLGNGFPCGASHTVGNNAPPAPLPVGLEPEAPLPVATPIPVITERQGGSWQLYRTISRISSRVSAATGTSTWPPKPRGSVRLTPGESIVARVDAADPENDGFRYVWELLEEPTVLGSGGSFEPRPAALGDVVDGSLPQLDLVAPEKTGKYRLFIYVLDPNGHVGTANIPFQVDAFLAADIASHDTLATDG